MGFVIVPHSARAAQLVVVVMLASVVGGEFHMSLQYRFIAALFRRRGSLLPSTTVLGCSIVKKTILLSPRAFPPL